MWSHVNTDPDHDPHIQQKNLVFYLEGRGVAEEQKLKDNLTTYQGPVSENKQDPQDVSTNTSACGANLMT